MKMMLNNKDDGGVGDVDDDENALLFQKLLVTLKFKKEDAGKQTHDILAKQNRKPSKQTDTNIAIYLNP